MINGAKIVRLVAAKSKLAPSQGTSLPMAELNGLLYLTRMLRVVVHGFSEKPSKIYTFGNSECSIAMLEKSGSSLSPYFCYCVGEIKSNMQEISSISPVMHIYHIAWEN